MACVSNSSEVHPSSLKYVKHDPTDCACTCLNCLAFNLEGEEGEEQEYTDVVEERLELLEELEKVVNDQLQVVSQPPTLEEFQMVVNYLADHLEEKGCPTLIKMIRETSKEEQMWNAIFPLLKEEERPHIGMVVNHLHYVLIKEMFPLLVKDHEKMAERHHNTTAILIIAEAFMKELTRL
jgi:hypothetical protein